ncbi:MAG: class I adenylate-forming enzyme family protein [Pseudomonadota bacterium]
MLFEDLLQKHAIERPDAEAVVFKDQRITYGQYLRETDRAAMGLVKAGVKAGDKVGIYLPNRPENIFIKLGAIKIGATAVPLSWRFTPRELRFVLQNAEVSLVALTPEFLGIDLLANLQEARKETPLLGKVVILDGKTVDGMIPYHEFLAEPGPGLEKIKAEVDENKPALFIYTSGTTGIPKAAMLTQKNMLSYAARACEVTNAQPGLGLLVNIPLNHVGGAVMGVVNSLYGGCKLVLMDVFDPQKTLQIIQDEKIGIFGQVPAQYALELLLPDIEKYDFSAVTFPIVSSQPCPSEMIMAIKNRFGVMPLNAYGLTEVSGAITFTAKDSPLEKLKYSVGRPINGLEMVIMNERDEILHQGEVGEICFKGDMVMKGYWKRPDEDAKVFDRRGFFHTGDMGRVDAEGYLAIVGRKKEMFIRGGENVYPPEIEEVIAQHPDVMMVAVIGIPDPVMGEVGRAYVVAKPGTSPTEEGIKDFLGDKLARYKIPAEVAFRQALPLTLLGKVKKLDLYKEVELERQAKEKQNAVS